MRIKKVINRRFAPQVNHPLPLRESGANRSQRFLSHQPWLYIRLRLCRLRRKLRWRRSKSYSRCSGPSLLKTWLSSKLLRWLKTTIRSWILWLLGNIRYSPVSLKNRWLQVPATAAILTSRKRCIEVCALQTCLHTARTGKTAPWTTLRC